MPIKILAQKVSIGAYYFDGWTGADARHITKPLKDIYSIREPKWGWITSTQGIVDAQIQLARRAGLSFFSFCWYFSGPEKYKTEPLNNALRLYQTSKYNKQLKYCLMVANHSGFLITPSNWDFVMNEWISQFKSERYLKIDSKPLIIFVSVRPLIESFGSAEAVNKAFILFRETAQKNGIPNISIAACVIPDKNMIDNATACGFDLLTGYNYPGAGFTTKSQQIPIDSMQNAERRLWSKFKHLSNLKYIPAATLNWDPRAWANSSNGYNEAPYYVGYSEQSVYKSVDGIIDWLNNNSTNTTAEKIGLLYAWNENGEGAYLTPSKKGPNFLRGVRKAIYKNNGAKK